MDGLSSVIYLRPFGTGVYFPGSKNERIQEMKNRIRAYAFLGFFGVLAYCGVRIYFAGIGMFGGF